ncbi:MAG: hypothetical protein ACOYL6_07650 [Bacteriovoracaceae bacterium]
MMEILQGAIASQFKGLLESLRILRDFLKETMTKLSKLLAVLAILLITLSTLAAKDFAKEKIVIGICSDKALAIAEGQALISFGSRNIIRQEPEVELVSQNDETFTMTFEVKGIPAVSAETSTCSYIVEMHRNNLGDCWMEQIKQTTCI